MAGQTILCVDDDQDDQMLLTEAIRELAPQLKVVQAENGVEALRYLESAKEDSDLPCLIVLDINMPMMDGRQTLENIRRNIGTNGLSIVVLTSSENPRDKQYFVEQGIGLFVKPFDSRQLSELVAQLLPHCTDSE